MSVTFRKGKAEDWKIVYDLICDMEGTELPAEAFRGIYDEKRFFSFFGENWGCPGLPFPFTPCGFHRDPGGTEGSGNEHQDPPQL